MENNTVKKGKKGVIVASIAILAFAGFAGFNYVKFKTQKKVKVIKEEKIPVEVAESKVMDLKWILEQTGDIRATIEVDVYPKVDGEILKKLLVEKGDFVKKGALIAILEDNTITAQVEEAGAALESAKANLKQIEANLEVIEKDRVRLENLYKKKAVAKQKLDHIDAEYKAAFEGKKLAEAQISRAKAAMEQLEILYANHKIRAPASGYVSARYVDQGAMSDTKEPIIRISAEEEVKIVTTVTEKDFPHIKKGMRVEIRVDAFPQRIFSGTVSIINPTLDPATRTGEIEIHIENKDRMLRSGMFARVKLYLGERGSLVVLRDGLVRLPGTGNYYLYVVEDGKAVLKNIKTGLTQENYIEITHGLKQGEQVVVKGQNRLKDGVAVIIEAQESGLEGKGRSGK